MTTIFDVAERAGVGVGTVSRVLNDSPAVRSETRSRVLGVVRELDYHPSSAARALSIGKTLTIGVVAPFVTNPSVVERIRGVVEAVGSTRYDLVLFDVQSREKRDQVFRRVVQRGRVDGLLIVSLPPTDEEVERFQRADIPLVLIDAGHAELPSVVVDNKRGGYLAARHLIDLGHERIAFIGDVEDSPFRFVSSRDRRAGYVTALDEAGLVASPGLMKQGRHDSDAAAGLALELLASEEPPTGICAASDTQAMGVLLAARSAGIPVPGRLSVTGFDDIDLAGYVGLTTVRQALRAGGERGVELLLQGLDEDRRTPVREVMPIELVERNTTAARPDGRAPP